jgi:hypothetical protein
MYPAPPKMLLDAANLAVCSYPTQFCRWNLLDHCENTKAGDMCGVVCALPPAAVAADGDTVVIESLLIVDYLDLKYPYHGTKLYPNDPADIFKASLNFGG